MEALRPHAVAPVTAAPSPPEVHRQVAELGTILSIWAHPDDETYLAAGVMAAAADLGQRVVCVSMTAGEHGTDDPAGWPPARLAARRRWEMAAAMAALGVPEHHVLGLPDGELDRVDAWGCELVDQLIADVQPDTVLTFGADGITFHPDHIAVHRWVTAAWRRHERSFRLLQAVTTDAHLEQFGDRYEEWGTYMTDERPVGVAIGDLALHLELAGPALDRKLAALHALSSQTRGITGVMEPAMYEQLVAEEAFVDAGTRWPGAR